jgi:rhamnulokinase
MLGTLHKEGLTISEARRFPNAPVESKGGLQWNVPHLYREILEGLRGASDYDEPVDSVSCTSWSGDYMLFDQDGSLLTPALHGAGKTDRGMQKILDSVPWEALYEETGIAKSFDTTLFQLGAEHAKRLKRANHLLPVADGFNFLLGGVPRVELSLASPTQLFDPTSKTWSERLLKSLKIRPELLPPIVPGGTVLGPLKPEIAKETRMEEAQVVASCSHNIAAALAGLPVQPGERWAYLRPGSTALMGTVLEKPLMNEISRDLGFTNEVGYKGSICFHRRLTGLSVLEECQKIWEKENRQVDPDLLSHIAASSTPFESLIDLSDPRFQEPEDMTLKIQAFCKETKQPIPRKPGPIFRCVLESLALNHRKALQQIQYLTDLQVERLYILGAGAHSLLNHFIANALEVPVVIVSDDAAAIGNIVVQALALGHLESLEQARELVGRSFKTETIMPHPTAWAAAYDRFEALTTAAEEATPAAEEAKS